MVGAMNPAYRNRRLVERLNVSAIIKEATFIHPSATGAKTYTTYNHN